MKLFKLIKNIFKKDTVDIIKDVDMDKYCAHVDDCFINKKNKPIGCFTYNGYKHIYQTLIFNTKNKINIVCKDYDSIFNKELFPLFLLKIRDGIIVNIVTYDGNVNTIFEDLEKKYENFHYFPMKKITDNYYNDFIVVDENSYWVKDSSMTKYLKSCANFADYIYCAKLLDKIEKLKKIYLKNNKVS